MITGRCCRKAPSPGPWLPAEIAEQQELSLISQLQSPGRMNVLCIQTSSCEEAESSFSFGSVHKNHFGIIILIFGRTRDSVFLIGKSCPSASSSVIRMHVDPRLSGTLSWDRSPDGACPHSTASSGKVPCVRGTISQVSSFLSFLRASSKDWMPEP